MNTDVITTPRLTLRRFTMEDSIALHPIFSDPESMQYWSTPPHTTMQETETFVSQTIDAVANNTGDDFVVVFENKVVGKAGLWNNTEIGFIINRAVWGRGIATEAVQAIIERAKAKGIPAIVADVDPRNSRSLNVLQKCGFIETGREKNTMTVGGVSVDSVYLKCDLL